MNDQPLFPDFLRDPQQYDQAEALWAAKWQEFIQRTGLDGSWESPFYTTTFVDGTPCRDANPIFSAADPVRRLGVRVIQFEPTSDSEEIVSWFNTFAKGEPEEIHELVISCSLTNSTLSKAFDLIRQWITENPLGTNGEPAANPSSLPYFVPADRPA
jgi:hypothetical protein